MKTTHKILGTILFADFAAFTGYVLYTHGISGFVELATQNLVVLQLLADLVIGLLMVSVWMYRDAKKTGRNATPYLMMTLCLGSIGPMLYLLMTPSERALPAGAPAAA